MLFAVRFHHAILLYHVQLANFLFSVSESQLNVVLVLEKRFQVVVKPELEKTIVGQNLLLCDEHLRCHKNNPLKSALSLTQLITETMENY